MKESTPPRKKNILAVDDERIIQKMIHKILTKQGYHVISAINGKEALEKVLFEDIDLIILDIMMPVMDGFETLRMLKKMKHTRHIPVIILTANANVRTFSRVVKMGADDFIAKPFDQVSLRRKLEYLLQDAECRKAEIQFILAEEPTTLTPDDGEFQKRRQEFIAGFEKVFPKFVYMVSHQNGEELRRMLLSFEKKCENLHFEKASRLSLKIIFTIDQQGDWEDIVHYLEEIYNYFQSLESESVKA